MRPLTPSRLRSHQGAPLRMSQWPLLNLTDTHVEMRRHATLSVGRGETGVPFILQEHFLRSLRAASWTAGDAATSPSTLSCKTSRATMFQTRSRENRHHSHQLIHPPRLVPLLLAIWGVVV